MMLHERVRLVAISLAMVALIPMSASAQVLSNVGAVNLSAALAQTLSISITSGSTVNFTLTNGSAAAGDVPAVIATTWNLNPGQTGAVSLYGYFDTPAAAMLSGSDQLASSLVEGRVTTGTPTTFTAFTQTGPVGAAGGSLALFTEAITGVNKIKTRTDNLDLRVNLAGQTLPAGSYSGVLKIQARAL